MTPIPAELVRRILEGCVHADPTIGTCWDADRLDLWRVGITPHARFLRTGDHLVPPVVADWSR